MKSFCSDVDAHGAPTLQNRGSRGLLVVSIKAPTEEAHVVRRALECFLLGFTVTRWKSTPGFRSGFLVISPASLIRAEPEVLVLAFGLK